jgi:two-component system, chemotaxis family, sensor kinase CheA
MDASQYAELFLTESREHLSAINQWLLELEKSGGADGNAEAVGAIFRAVHTVKGMSATMGYTLVAELSHELESLLDRVRQRELSVDAQLMDLLFRAADALEHAIESAVKGGASDPRAEAASAEVLRRLRALSETPDGSSRSATDRGDREWTVPAPEGNGTLVRVRLIKESPLKGVRAFLVVEALRKLGDVTVVAPPVSALQADQFDRDFALRLTGPATTDEIRRAAMAAGDVETVRVGDDAAGTVIDARRSGRESGERSASSIGSTTGELEIPGTSGEFSLMPTGEYPAIAANLQGTGEFPAIPAEPLTPPGVARTTRAIDLAAVTGANTGVRQQRHVRIDLRRLDSLMNLIGELVITRGRLTQLAAGLGDQALGESVTQAARLIGDLRDEIMTSRMVPVWQVFDRFPRLVRDASRSLGKRIEFTIEGKDIELDRSMLDEIGEPIVHLLRNAIDHGLETPEQREATGKPAAGKLSLSTARDRSAVVLRVTDDGRGVDREKVLARAKSAGLVESSKSELNDDELLRLISRPGFSTADKVTDLSGRGVGIDAVYSRVRSLGGAVDIRSVPGHGTTVTLRLPLTLAIVRALLARVGSEFYAIPLTHVSETVELHERLLRSLQGNEVLVLRGEVIPVLRLRALVGLEPWEATPSTIGGGRIREYLTEQVVIIDLPDRRAGLVVDELIGQQEIVVKQFDGMKQGLQLFGGATILGDGSPALIVDVSTL